MVEFKKQFYGADVATIADDDNQLLEVTRRSDGLFELTVHNRRDGEDRWDDLSVVLKPAHFVELGKIADMVLCREDGCPQFGKPPARSCKCNALTAEMMDGT